MTAATAPGSERLSEFLASADPEATFIEQMRRIIAKRGAGPRGGAHLLGAGGARAGRPGLAA